MRPILLLLLTLMCATGTLAQERPHAFLGAEIIPVSGPPIPNGVLVVHRGKITAVGPAASTQIPPDAERINASGKIIMPGLVDTHSHIGGGSGADASAPLQPEVRLMDSFDARDTSIKRARAGGITTVNVMPGSGHLLSGQTLYLKLRNGATVDDLFIRNSRGEIAGGIKMANGTNSIRPGGGAFPGTRAKSAALARDMFVRAQAYRDKVARAAGDKEKLPPRDLAMEALVEVLEGRRTVQFHTHRQDDILTVLRLSKEFGFRVVLQHVSEGWKVAEEIAKAGAPCSIINVDAPGGKIEAINMSHENAAILDRAGALVGFHTDDSVTDSRHFLRSAALSVRAGLSREKALYGLTMAGARMLELENSVGTLQLGKDADFILLSGDPLSVYTKVLETWIEGVKVFDRSKPEDKLYAVGGEGAGRDANLHVHEEGEQR
ncbi:MAG: amidohydrolase family protein [Acidobacteria bacterium]|nr:amidohydrolase family protein [Acidobacteriota bacterium]MCW5966935.1 amidohydrolase family protein [Blastocatellales bacterium]